MNGMNVRTPIEKQSHNFGRSADNCTVQWMASRSIHITHQLGLCIEKTAHDPHITRFRGDMNRMIFPCV
jgi:hypothetical protein